MCSDLRGKVPGSCSACVTDAAKILEDMIEQSGDMKAESQTEFIMVKGDITTGHQCDAIVNAANTSLTTTGTFDDSVSVEGLNYYTKKELSGDKKTLTFSDKLVNESGVYNQIGTWTGGTYIGTNADLTNAATGTTYQTAGQALAHLDSQIGTWTGGNYIKATSLKENYDKFKHSGLFALNLRFYIADKKVDPEIERTIKELKQHASTNHHTNGNNV